MLSSLIFPVFYYLLHRVRTSTEIYVHERRCLKSNELFYILTVGSYKLRTQIRRDAA